MKKLFSLLTIITVAAMCSALFSCSADDNENIPEDNITNDSDQNVEKNEEGSVIKTIKVKGVSFKMILVEGGTFKMGATKEQTTSGEKVFDWEFPVHNVQLKSYYIAETEVTNQLYDSIMGTTEDYHHWASKGKYHPRSGSKEFFDKFIAKLNQESGMSFRYPTEAEWEFAARGGNKSKSYIFSGSDSRTRVGWYYCNSGDGYLVESNWSWGEWNANHNSTHVVATAYPNELGIYDMSGNLYEFCSDYYGPYSEEDAVNPRANIDHGEGFSIRGGSFAHFSNNGRCSHREHSGNQAEMYMGCRLALDL